MRYLGVDYGKKRIGLAVSEGELATPYQVLEVEGLDEAVARISRVVKDEEIDCLVVGLPESGEARGMVEKFIRKIKEIKEIEVIEVEETLSTHQAIQERVIQGLAKDREDAIAAAVILQDFLDHKR